MTIWKQLEDKIKQLEAFFEKENVKIAHIVGKKLLSLIKKNKLTPEDMVGCLENMEDVASQLNILSLKYKGPSKR